MGGLTITMIEQAWLFAVVQAWQRLDIGQKQASIYTFAYEYLTKPSAMQHSSSPGSYLSAGLGIHSI